MYHDPLLLHVVVAIVVLLINTVQVFFIPEIIVVTMFVILIFITIIIVISISVIVIIAIVYCALAEGQRTLA